MHTKLSSSPDYEDSKDFFFWGLTGQYDIDVSQICKSSKPLQMQTVQTAKDGFLGLITLGIYYPHSVKIWCDDE